MDPCVVDPCVVDPCVALDVGAFGCYCSSAYSTRVNWAWMDDTSPQGMISSGME